MAKSLQEQLLAAGLADKQKAKKAAKEMKKQEHLQRTGQDNQLDDVKAKAEAVRKEKAERDRELNRQREEEVHLKAIAAQVRQLITNNAIAAQYGDIKYQFVDGTKIKHIYVDQAVWDRLSRGQLAIIAHGNSYAVIPVPVADKIRERADKIFILVADKKAEILAEDDPYAAYQIPDDLMW